MAGIIESFKRIYSDDNALVKHLILFVLTGVVSMFSLTINEMSRHQLNNGQWWFVMTAVVACVAIGIYIAGYIYEFIHKLHGDESGLPDFNIRHFLKGLKFIPVVLAWIGYLAVILAVCIFAGMFHKITGTVLFCLLLLFVLFLLIMGPMIVVDYAKEYHIKGLLSPIKPFKYVKDALGRISILIVKALPLIILLAVLHIISASDKSVLGFLVASAEGYLLFVFCMIMSFCYFNIHKETYGKQD